MKQIKEWVRERSKVRPRYPQKLYNPIIISIDQTEIGMVLCTQLPPKNKTKKNYPQTQL